MLKSYKKKFESRAMGLEEKNSIQSTDNPHIRCATLISNMENPQTPSFKLWDLNMQVQGYQKVNPTST